jgi:type I restriction enzyme R subunit
MSQVGERERRTQEQVIGFFQGALGYRYLGNWKDREDNRPVDEALLSEWLHSRGVEQVLINRALRRLDQERAITGSKGLYDANRAVYELLRYGVKVKRAVGEQTETVWLVDWEHPENNDFAVAEEVTVNGQHTKRPDVVLYLNGIAVGVLELKRSTVSVTEGIRQNLDNQKPAFIESFFSTVQLILAGSASEGLRYGVIATPEKYWLEWKESTELENRLESGLYQLCRKERLLEVIHDFMVYDAGIKKTCRHNQYFGVRAAQDYVRRREGGIIWHTQGSGKSLTMVWLAKWIRENISGSRVLLITDRTELDDQIEKVFKGVNEDIYRTRSGADLINVLNDSQEWLIASLVHKFGVSEDKAMDDFVDDLTGHLPPGFSPKGEIFVFVDECHRTQSGKLHDAMKKLLPGATLIGFTGTPLLKKDKRRSIEVFGPYIHTYKFDQAIRDGVVLDLRYEARDIDQTLTSPEKVDQWFERHTRDLNDYARAELKKRWGSMQKLMSSRERLNQIVKDIVWDMDTRDRLMSGHGNAMLVAGSIYSACRFYELFEQTPLKGKCAIVSSYTPSAADIKGEATGEGETEKLHQYEIYRKMLAEHFREHEDKAMHKVEQFEKEVKKRFIEEPGRMKLLIVVDKLLTGFDAPPATYLYIDKKMRDHGLFQAICRVNRLHTEDKEVGYIVDYKDLFSSLESSLNDYTGEAFEGYDKEDVQGLLKNRLEQARERLEEARESIKALCEAVAPPKDSAAYRQYFVGPSDDPDRQKDNEPKRVALYKLAASYLRAYAELANEMQEAGFTEVEARDIKAEVDHYEKVREEVKLASGDYVDMKVFEPAMRHLLDSFIRADETKVLSAFDDMTLVDLIVERGEAGIEALPASIKKDQEAMAETIENNVRRLIIDEMAVNPKYYERMSELLDALIEERRQQAIEYQEYLQRIVQLSREVARKDHSSGGYPSGIDTGAKQALYDNLGGDAGLAIRLDQVIRDTKAADFRDNHFKRKEVYLAIKRVLENHVSESGGHDPDAVFELVLNQHEY